MPLPERSSSAALTAVKVIHTLVWAFFVLCILAIPFCTLRAHYAQATVFIGIVGVEVLVLAFNAWTCPLTRVAARHTTERRANFDIYLPEWLARHNKVIFGALYVGAVVFTLIRWAHT
jgi:hypothetical protein